MRTLLSRLANNDSGATAIEYTLIAALIAVASIVAMRGLGGTVNNVLTTASNAMT